MNPRMLFLSLFFALIRTYSQSQAEFNTDSLEALLAKQIPDSTKIDIYNDLGFKWYQKDAAKCIHFFEEGVKLAAKGKDDKRLNEIKLWLGWHYKLTGDFPKAIITMDEVLMATKGKDHFLHSAANGFQAYNYLELGERLKSITYQREGYNEAEQYVLKMDSRGRTGLAMGMAEIFEQNNILDSAFFYARIAHSRLMEMEHPETGNSFSQHIPIIIGNIFYKMNQFDSAMIYYRKGLINAQMNQSTDGIQNGALALGKAELKLGLDESALKHLKYALQNSVNIKNYPVIRDAGELLNTYYFLKGDLKNAYYYSGISNAAKDSISGVNKLRQIQSYQIEEVIKQQQKLQEVERSRIQAENKYKSNM